MTKQTSIENKYNSLFSYNERQTWFQDHGHQELNLLNLKIVLIFLLKLKYEKPLEICFNNRRSFNKKFYKTT
jgi:hypothetical protein